MSKIDCLPNALAYFTHRDRLFHSLLDPTMPAHFVFHAQADGPHEA
jgi:hypothetical protein